MIFHDFPCCKKLPRGTPVVLGDVPLAEAGDIRLDPYEIPKLLVISQDPRTNGSVDNPSTTNS